ncbi:MAG: diguanylate cyclase domain-containing protein [Rhodoferax sp.]
MSIVKPGDEGRHSRSVPWLLVLVAAGLAGNYFKYPLFLNIDFLFGSVFSMLALQFFGLRGGVLAAALVSSYTYLLWNHPYAIVVMTAEAAVVGWLMARRKMGMLLADSIYWIVLGMPLAFVCYHLMMKTSLSSTSIVMLKQAVNGVANALLARIVFAGISGRYRVAQMQFQELVCNLLTAFILFPALVMLAISSRTDFDETDRSIRDAFEQKSRIMNSHLVDWVQERTQVVVHLTELAATLTAQQMQGRLEQARAADSSFLRLGMRDTDSVITAYSPRLDESGQSNVGKKFPERPYIAQLRMNLKPMLAEVVMGRIDKKEPVVILLAPVLRQGQYAGYVNSVLRLDHIRKHLEEFSERQDLFYTLVDSKGNTILSNRKDQTMMTPFGRGEGSLKTIDATISQWRPSLPPNTSISEQWKNSYYVAQTAIGDPGGWQLILEQPVAPFQKVLYNSYTGKLTLLFLIMLLALALAELLSRRATVTLERLGEITQDLPLKLGSKGGEVLWPQSSIVQTSQLIKNFRTMSDSLTAQFNDLQRANETLDQRVRERTAELAESEQRFRQFIEDNSSVMMLIEPQSGKIEDVNFEAITYYGYSREQLTGMTISDIDPHAIAPLNPQDTLAAPHGRKYLNNQHHLASGDVRDVEVYSTPIETRGRTLLFTIVHDVTERRRSRVALTQSEEEHRLLIENSHDIIYTLNADGVFSFVSNAWTSLLGHPLNQVIGHPFVEFIHPDDQTGFMNSFRNLFSTGERQHDVEYQIKHVDGSWRWHSSNALPLRDNNEQVIGFEGNAKDITEHREIEDRVRQLAYHDALTGLPNRRLLDDRLGQAMAASQRSGRYGALMFLDLDNFKPLNDAHGHGTGDLLLIEVTRRLTQCVREVDTVARFGGDEFVVMLCELDTDQAVSVVQAQAIAEKIRDTLSQPYQLALSQGGGGVVEHHCTASIGLVMFVNHESSMDQILKWGDMAMYQAKDEGRNLIRLHQNEGQA